MADAGALHVHVVVDHDLHLSSCWRRFGENLEWRFAVSTVVLGMRVRSSCARPDRFYQLRFFTFQHTVPRTPNTTYTDSQYVKKRARVQTEERIAHENRPAAAPDSVMYLMMPWRPVAMILIVYVRKRPRAPRAPSSPRTRAATPPPRPVGHRGATDRRRGGALHSPKCGASATDLSGRSACHTHDANS